MNKNRTARLSLVDDVHVPVGGYLARRQEAVKKFWRRLGGRPDVRGKSVLDLGCGQGALCFDLAQAGARRVLGIDLNPDEVEAANNSLTLHYAVFDDVLAFRVVDIRDLQEEFDLVVSADAFEHILELESVLVHVARLLRPGGSLLVGFGPLYNSPYGGHRRMHMPIPWGHRMLPEPWLIRWVNRYRETPVASVEELGLNKLALKDFLRLFDSSGLEVVFLRPYHGDRLMSRVFATLARVPLLRESFSHDIHCIMRKPHRADPGSGRPPGAIDDRPAGGTRRVPGQSVSPLQMRDASPRKIVDGLPTN